MIRNRYKLDEICEFINGGSWTQNEYSDIGVPVIQVTNLQQGSVELKGLKLLGLESYEKYKKHELKYNDLVIATVGSHATQPNSVVGRASSIPKEAEGYLLNQNAVCIRSTNPNIEQKFLIYLGKSKIMHDHIISRAKGSANQVRMAISALKEFEFDFPDINTQKKIAKILSSYDDLIENNLKRIKLLEESVELIYKEWFVNLRFIGYENCNIVNGVPYGWSLSNIENLIEFNIGGGWGEESFNGDFSEAAYVIRGTDIPKIKQGIWSEIPFRYHKRSNLKSRKLCGNDIVFEVSGGSRGQSVGRSILINESLLNEFNDDVMCASFCKLIRCKNKDMAYYLYGYLNESRKNGDLLKYEKQSASNIVNFAYNSFVNEQQIILPDKSILEQYVKIVEPIMSNISNNIKQLRKLKEARDILIPRLISGEIEV